MPNEPKVNLPASLLVENRPCLVVGGGKVAARKAKSLIGALASVTVAAPDVCDEIRELTDNGQIEHRDREFAPDDLEGMFLVFAATDSEDVNKAVLSAARDRKVLCCCVDASWRDSDFVSPASFKHDGITISVSTGGRSCTEARDVKNALLEYLKNMDKLTSADQK